MPYIDQNARSLVELRSNPQNAGELAYLLCIEVDGYLNDADRISYAKYAEVVGVLETLKLELYRRFVGPYEDQKREENGEAFFHAR
jgi:hypothetical protein